MENERGNVSSASSSTTNTRGEGAKEGSIEQQKAPPITTTSTESPSPISVAEVLLNSGFPNPLMGSVPGSFSMPPLMYHLLPQEGQQMQQSGIYAVGVVPWASMFPPGGLIPLTYNIPSNITPGLENAQPDGSLIQSDTGRDSPAEAHEAPAAEGLRQRHGAPARDAQGQRQDNQRQPVRRFQVGFQLDLLLILKLAVVVFVFNQDGSKERLFLLLSLATLVYLYQTGALAPLLRWLSQSAQRARLPPQHPGRVQPQHAARPEGHQEAGNGPNAQNVEHQGLQDVAVQDVPNDPDGPPGRFNQENGHPQGLNWWGFVKEVQMIVVGFVTSLLPGFHHAD